MGKLAVFVEGQTEQLFVQRLVQEVAGVGIDIGHGPSRIADIERNFSSIEKAKAQLGWAPEVVLRDGLQQTWDWLRANTAPTSPN